MNSENNSSSASTKPFSSKENGAKNRRKKSLKPSSKLYPQRGMGIAKLEELRLSALKNPNQQPFGYHQQPNGMMNFGGLRGLTVSVSADGHSQPFGSWERNLVVDSNNFQVAENPQETHFAYAQPVMQFPTSTTPFAPACFREAGNIEMDLLGKMRRRDEGRDDKINLELKL